MASQPNLSQTLWFKKILSLSKEELTLGNHNKQTGRR